MKLEKFVSRFFFFFFWMGLRHPYLVMALSLSLSLFFLFGLVVLLVETVWTSKRIHKKENITSKILCDEETKNKK